VPRRLLSLLLLVFFGYFNAEAAIADVCDGDAVGMVPVPGDIHASAPGSAPERSNDSGRPVHDVTHVCHCAHAHGPVTTEVTVSVADVAFHHRVGETALLQPLGTDRDVHLRPPIAHSLNS
jgi:hypothetical protein